jgi:hypothetical protein
VIHIEVVQDVENVGSKLQPYALGQRNSLETPASIAMLRAQRLRETFPRFEAGGMRRIDQTIDCPPGGVNETPGTVVVLPSGVSAELRSIVTF